MDRREFVRGGVALALLAAPLVIEAQQTRPLRIGCLWHRIRLSALSERASGISVM